MKYLFIIFSFLAISACSQHKLDFGPIKADSHFSCNDEDLFGLKSTGLDNICNSKNELEIRVSVSYMPTPFYVLYVLTYNDSGWKAMKYERDFAHINPNAIPTITLKSQQAIENIFDTLKINNVFTLPDQDDLKVKTTVDDGDIYSVTFKVGDQFRKYNFNNPKLCQEEYREVKEFTNYLNIANVFYNAFDKH